MEIYKSIRLKLSASLLICAQHDEGDVGTLCKMNGLGRRILCVLKS